jgi:hypothetical protein
LGGIAVAAIQQADEQSVLWENWRAFDFGQYRDVDGDGLRDWWGETNSFWNCDAHRDPV